MICWSFRKETFSIDRGYFVSDSRFQITHMNQFFGSKKTQEKTKIFFPQCNICDPRQPSLHYCAIETNVHGDTSSVKSSQISPPNETPATQGPLLPSSYTLRFNIQSCIKRLLY
jgi:hypothetical protein